MAKLSKDEIVTLQTLADKGQSNRAIARQLNVTEGAVRYHRRRQATGATDGRKKQSLIESLSLVEVVRLPTIGSGRVKFVFSCGELSVHEGFFDGDHDDADF